MFSNLRCLSNCISFVLGDWQNRITMIEELQ